MSSASIYCRSNFNLSPAGLILVIDKLWKKEIDVIVAAPAVSNVTELKLQMAQILIN